MSATRPYRLTFWGMWDPVMTCRGSDPALVEGLGCPLVFASATAFGRAARPFFAAAAVSSACAEGIPSARSPARSMTQDVLWRNLPLAFAAAVDDLSGFMGAP